MQVTVSADDVKTLINRLKPTDFQSKAYLDLTFHSGLRPAEACSLKWSEINGDRVYVRNGKGGKSRWVDLASTYGHLEAWREVSGGEGYVFKTRTGAAWKTSHVRRLFTRLSERTGIDVSPHGMRHAHALAVWNHTKDLELVSGQLGHVRLSTTDEYLKGRGTQLGRVAVLSF